MKTIVALLLLFSINLISAQARFKNIDSIIGTDYAKLGDQISLDDVTLINTGSGYLIAKDDKSKNDFGINYCHSQTSLFFLLIEFRETNGQKQRIITDILEIKKSEIAPNQKITEYCQTKTGFDAEVFALVKDEPNSEFYTHIIKAWRANRETAKFETIKPRKIRKCGNESHGI
jgi:hypothetical protein